MAKAKDEAVLQREMASIKRELAKCQHDLAEAQDRISELHGRTRDAEKTAAVVLTALCDLCSFLDRMGK